MFETFTAQHARQEIDEKIRRASQRRIADRARAARRSRRTIPTY